MNWNLKISLQALPPNPNSTRWNQGFSLRIFSKDYSFKIPLPNTGKYAPKNIHLIFYGVFFFPSFHSKTISLENFYAFAINYLLCNLTVYGKPMVNGAMCFFLSLTCGNVTSLPQLESVLLGTLPRAWTDRTVWFCPTWYHKEIHVTSVLRQCLLGTFVFPFAIHLWWAGSSLLEKRKHGPLFLFGASPIMSSCEVELGLFCWDNCMMVQQKLGLYSLPGTVWRKKSIFWPPIYFSICLKFCINNAK